MRTTRTLFASAATIAVLAISAPFANAAPTADEWGSESGSSSSSEEGKYEEKGKEKYQDKGKEKYKYQDKDKSWSGESSWKDKKPHGGVHAGGGALTMTASGDEESVYGSKKEKYEDKGKYEDKDKSWSGESSWKDKKPHGGVHAGGGGLAASGGNAAAGSVLILGGLGAGAYILRRRSSGAVA